MYELKENKKDIFLIALGILLISLDQLVKYKIRTQGGFYICNKNLAFDLSILNFLLLSLGFVMVLVVFNLKSILNFKFRSFISKGVHLSTRGIKASNLTTIQSVSVFFIISGALANIIDRLHYGCVTDFINLGFWPVFNLADIYITIGTIIIISTILKKR